MVTSYPSPFGNPPILVPSVSSAFPTCAAVVDSHLIPSSHILDGHQLHVVSCIGRGAKSMLWFRSRMPGKPGVGSGDVALQGHQPHAVSGWDRAAAWLRRTPT